MFSFVSTARGDGLYDSYMRTDHILKEESDTNSPSGLPPMPKHAVSIQQFPVSMRNSLPLQKAGHFVPLLLSAFGIDS